MGYERLWQGVIDTFLMVGVSSLIALLVIAATIADLRGEPVEQLLRHTREVVRTGPMLYGEGWIPTQITREPRRLWVSEVELLGKCADGSTMSFKLGPMDGRRPPDRPESGPTYQGYWDDWFKQAGDHLPLAIHITPAPEKPNPWHAQC